MRLECIFKKILRADVIKQRSTDRILPTAVGSHMYRLYASISIFYSSSRFYVAQIKMEVLP